MLKNVTVRYCIMIGVKQEIAIHKKEESST